MKNKIIKKSMYILLILIMLLNSIAPIATAYTVKLGERTKLCAEKELPGFVQYKSDGSLKLVYRVFYKDDEKRLDAFCLEPLKDGVGTGGGDSYYTQIKKEIDDMRVWRALYHGYLGKKWNETTPDDTDNKELKSGPVVESDDDWYFVTKLVIHCLNEETPIAPKSKYEVPTHIASSDERLGLTLEDVKRRGTKILDAAEKLYNYAVSGTENYEEGKISLIKNGEMYVSGDNLVQDFNLTSNKELKSYDVSLEGFLSGVSYTKNSNKISVKIPKDIITKDIQGTIKITNAQIKTYPAFYAEADNPDYQDYVVVATAYEELSTQTDFEAELNKSKIEILKIDKDTKEPIPDTTLEISKDNEVVETVKTGKDGKASVENLYPGDYQVKEIEANEDYLLSDEVKKVKLEYGNVTKVTFENTRKTGNLKLIKVDKDNNEVALGNVEFDLYSEEKGKVIGTYHTNVDGEISVENLRVGNYKWIEKNTNKWYNFNEVETQVKVKWNETNESIVENELKKGQIKVIKLDKENEKIKLKDVEFNVIDENGNILETIKTDENGEAITKKYPVRDFQKLTLQETKTLENYVLDTNPQTVTLKENKVLNVTFKNEKKKGQIKVIKVDADNNEIKLPDIEFKVYDESGKVVDTLITDRNGEALSQKMPIDQKYRVKETKTGKWYVLDEKQQTAILKQDEITNLIFQNEKKKGQIRVIKVDEDNNEIKLPDVEFKVYDENDNIVDTLITDKNGMATSKKLPIDKTYTLKESKTLKNYVLSDVTKTVILEENEITNVEFTNQKIKGYIEITKISANDNSITGEKKGSTLPNAVFEIYTEDDKLVDTIVTKEDGKAKSKLLEYGKYYIKEKSTGSDYYLLNTEKYNIEIKEPLKTVEITIENESVDTKLDIEKTGVTKAKPNEEIKYEFNTLKNASNVSLDNFTWVDNLPYKYVRLTKLYTGTYNEDLNYVVKYKTNKSKDYIEYGTYNTKENNYINFTTLKLDENEYITDFKVEFGTVKAGFEALQKPIIYTKVLGTISQNEKWINYTYLTGNYKEHELEDKDEWPTTLYQEKKLPRTGF